MNSDSDGRLDFARRFGDDTLVTIEVLLELCDEVRLLVDEGKEQYFAQWKSRRASEAVIERIGETVRDRLPQEMLDHYDGQPWRQIAAMRNNLLHRYHEVNYQIVWSTMETSIPALRSYLRVDVLGLADESGSPENLLET